MKVRYDTLDNYIKEGSKPSDMTEKDWEFIKESRQYREAAAARGMDIAGITETGDFILIKKCSCEREMIVVRPDDLLS